MTGRSGPLAAQKRQPVSGRKDKAYRGVNKHTPRRPKSSRIAAIATNKNKGSIFQTDLKHGKEKAAPVNSTQRYSRSRTVRKSPVIKQLNPRKRVRKDDGTFYPAKRARVTVDSSVEPKAIDPKQNYINHWAKEQSWPKEYFEEDKINRLLARKGSALGRKRSNPSLAGASDEMPREEKSAPYRNPNYPTFLSDDVPNYKSYMKDHKLGISEASKKLLELLRNAEQSLPSGTLFDDQFFSKHLEKLKGKNESRVIQDLSPLLVPSAEALATFDHHLNPNSEEAIHNLYPELFPSREDVASFSAGHMDRIVESVNEGWNNCFTITKPHPQPDSAFGYGLSTFNDYQFDKLRPLLGDASFSSFFKTTFYMLFAYMTKEVKTGAIGLDTADNQNLHSITIAIRALVELYKLVDRKNELHREILGFTISHDDKSERIYAHYPFINGDKVTIWRHTVDQFYLDSCSKWRSWILTSNTHDIFSLINLRRIHSAIDGISSGLTSARHSKTQSSGSVQQANDDNASTTAASGLSQQLQDQILNDNQITPNTSIQDGPKSPKRKKSRTKRNEDN